VQTDDPGSSRREPLLRWPTYALGRLHALGRVRIGAALASVELTPRDYLALACLGEYGEQSQQQVADHTAMDRSDLVKLLDHLEAASLITRRRDTTDRRRHILTLTPDGTRALRAAEQIVERENRAVLAALTDSERHTLHVLVLKALGEPIGIADQAASETV
jgi:MarR family transcriptional regulator, lower aerobic nicotinate degradation pathway regulator